MHPQQEPRNLSQSNQSRVSVLVGSVYDTVCAVVVRIRTEIEKNNLVGWSVSTYLLGQPLKLNPNRIKQQPCITPDGTLSNHFWSVWLLPFAVRL